MRGVITQANAGSSISLSLTWLKGISATVLDLLFPPHCVACQRYGAWLCPECVDAIQVIQPPVCPRCGFPLSDSPRSPAPGASPTSPASLAHVRGSDSICGKCGMAPAELDGLRAFAFLGGSIRLAIHQFKYNDLRCLAVPLAELMSRGWSTLFPQDRVVSVIVPVPLHPARERKRGYNQAALLARELAPMLGLPMVGDVLVRTKATTPQVGLSPEERRANVRGAFACIGRSLDGARVLLVDDVYTTGSTMEAAALALREGGVHSVWAYTLARAG
jgi:ComF family protein